MLLLVYGQKRGNKKYGQWSEWSECSKLCGGGTRRMERPCLAASFRRCTEELVITEDCNTDSCKGPGLWGEWSEWSKCTASCSGGQRRRYRSCQGAEIGAEGCNTIPEEIENCNIFACPDEDACKDSLFDVAFLIEANALAGQQENEIKQFLKDLLSLYRPDISSSNAQICFVRFSSWPETMFKFNDLQSLNQALLGINEIKFYGKGADLNSGLSVINDFCFNTDNVSLSIINI